MSWTIPDKGEGQNDIQSIIFQEYLDVLVAGLNGVDCVLAGCIVTAQGSPDMTCAVAAGVVRSNGALFSVTAGNVTIGTAHSTNPRLDLVVVDNAGAKQVRGGTAAANPKPPARSANDVVLAVVYVPAADTTISTDQITDLRIVKDFTGPRGHIAGLTMSNAGGDTTNDITVAEGEATAEGKNALLTLAAAITKQIDATWAVGNNAGGMNTGSVADNTWYEVHLIKRPDTGVVDVMFTTTANRATLPTNYTLQRQIGWVRRGTATNLQFVQVGDYFTLVTAINDVSASTTTTATLVTLTVPPNTIARFRATITLNTTTTGASGILFRDPAEDSTAPSTTTGLMSLGNADIAAATGIMAGHFEIRVNSSSQIEHDSEGTTGSPVFDISTFGWIDTRGRV